MIATIIAMTVTILLCLWAFWLASEAKALAARASVLSSRASAKLSEFVASLERSNMDKGINLNHYLTDEDAWTSEDVTALVKAYRANPKAFE